MGKSRARRISRVWQALADSRGQKPKSRGIQPPAAIATSKRMTIIRSIRHAGSPQSQHTVQPFDGHSQGGNGSRDGLGKRGNIAVGNVWEPRQQRPQANEQAHADQHRPERFPDQLWGERIREGLQPCHRIRRPRKSDRQKSRRQPCDDKWWPRLLGSFLARHRGNAVKKMQHQQCCAGCRTRRKQSDEAIAKGNFRSELS